MNMNSQEHPRSVLLIGVPDAGKTNFLSRLWIKLDAGDGTLAKSGLPSDLDYLNSGADHLLKGEFAPRTPQDVQDKTEIPVKSTAKGEVFSGTLIVPDLPGEQVLSVYRTRQWSTEWETKIREGCGCLLFVRVDSKELIAPLDWMNCPAYFGTSLPSAATEKDADGKEKPPTQVVLVDWLQFLRRAFTRRVGGNYKPRIGIVVTAWDLVANEQKPAGPGAWIASNLPLLSQFVKTNKVDFEFEYFGVSVASGDLDADPEFKTSYLKGDPRKAGEVVHSLSGSAETTHDITLPVAWALGLDGATPKGSAHQK
jgi:hypothetical protein